MFGVLDDLKAAIIANWSDSNVAMPNLQLQNKRLTAGYGTRSQEDIFIYALEETPSIFGLGGRNYWHRVQATIDYSTNLSQARFETVADVMLETLKRSTKMVDGQIQMLITGIHNLSEFKDWHMVWDVVLERQSL